MLSFPNQWHPSIRLHPEFQRFCPSSTRTSPRYFIFDVMSIFVKVSWQWILFGLFSSFNSSSFDVCWDIKYWENTIKIHLWPLPGFLNVSINILRWLDGITDLMDMCLSKLQKLVKNREARQAAVNWVTELGMTEGLNWSEPSFLEKLPDNNITRTLAMWLELIEQYLLFLHFDVSTLCWVNVWLHFFFSI